MPNIRRIRILAGSNGSGKSSLFEGFAKQYKAGYFVNADNIEKSLADSGLVVMKVRSGEIVARWCVMICRAA
jgi:predicted ABC-type ATPase